MTRYLLAALLVVLPSIATAAPTSAPHPVATAAPSRAERLGDQFARDFETRVYRQLLSKEVATALTIPNSFSNGQVIDAGQINANFNAVRSWSTTVDNANVGPNGIFASQICPSAAACNSGQLTFGGSTNFFFPASIQVNGHSNAIQTTLSVLSVPTATAMAAGVFGGAVSLNLAALNLTMTGLSLNCDVLGGGSGTNTVQWFVSWGQQPNYSTSTPNAFPVGTAVSCATPQCYVQISATAIPTPATTASPMWVFPYFSAVRATPPGGPCRVQLHGTQSVQ